MDEQKARKRLEKAYNTAGDPTKSKERNEWVEYHIDQIRRNGKGVWNGKLAEEYIAHLEHQHRNSIPII